MDKEAIGNNLFLAFDILDITSESRERIKDRHNLNIVTVTDTWLSSHSIKAGGRVPYLVFGVELSIGCYDVRM